MKIAALLESLPSLTLLNVSSPKALRLFCCLPTEGILSTTAYTMKSVLRYRLHNTLLCRGARRVSSREAFSAGAVFSAALHHARGNTALSHVSFCDCKPPCKLSWQLLCIDADRSGCCRTDKKLPLLSPILFYLPPLFVLSFARVGNRASSFKSFGLRHEPCSRVLRHGHPSWPSILVF